MAKNESTAVNELIERVAAQKPLVADAADDLMFSPPRSAPPAPLPRHRSPSGTDQHPHVVARKPSHTPAAAMTMQGLGPALATGQRPAGRPSAAMTMQGLGSATRPPSPPQKARAQVPPLD